jgi:trehalose-6-phosphatase
MPLTPLDASNDTFAHIRLIATDMDGTLTIGEKFTPELFEALQQLQRAQINVIVVTGRSASLMSNVSSSDYPLMWMAMNGLAPPDIARPEPWRYI